MDIQLDQRMSAYDLFGHDEIFAQSSVPARARQSSDVDRSMQSFEL